MASSISYVRSEHSLPSTCICTNALGRPLWETFKMLALINLFGLVRVGKVTLGAKEASQRAISAPVENPCAWKS